MTSRPCRTPRASTAARCSADCGIQPPSAATTNMTAGTGPRPASMFGTNRSWPGHVDEGQLLPAGHLCRSTAFRAAPAARGQGHPGVAEVDGHAAAAFLRPAVRLHPGQRADQRGLPVVDVPGGRDDVHQAPALVAARADGRSEGRRSRPRRWRRSGGRRRLGRPSGGRAAARPSLCGRPRRGPRPGGRRAPRRSGSARSSGSATAALGSVTPGAPPPPTAAALATTLAGTPCAARVATIRSQRSMRTAGSAVSERATGGSGTGDRRLKGGEGQLVDAQGAGERVPQQAADQGLVAEQQAGLRAAEQLVAAGGDQVRAVAQGGRGVGLVGQQRVRGEQPRADVVDERGRSVRRVPRRRPPW